MRRRGARRRRRRRGASSNWSSRGTRSFAGARRRWCVSWRGTTRCAPCSSRQGPSPTCWRDSPRTTRRASPTASSPWRCSCALAASSPSGCRGAPRPPTPRPPTSPSALLRVTRVIPTFTKAPRPCSIASPVALATSPSPRKTPAPLSSTLCATTPATPTSTTRPTAHSPPSTPSLRSQLCALVVPTLLPKQRLPRGVILLQKERRRRREVRRRRREVRRLLRSP
mmetsp:Transcript_21019/g.64909  ORF Transcript_21019/g.64909 Transcript_21019/m.64909 type:complete len:225 (-) Transcript_21019:193-867(-)